jgi:hypothetical protein
MPRRKTEIFQNAKNQTKCSQANILEVQKAIVEAPGGSYI